MLMRGALGGDVGGGHPAVDALKDGRVFAHDGVGLLQRDEVVVLGRAVHVPRVRVRHAVCSRNTHDTPGGAGVGGVGGVGAGGGGGGGGGGGNSNAAGNASDFEPTYGNDEFGNVEPKPDNYGYGIPDPLPEGHDGSTGSNAAGAAAAATYSPGLPSMQQAGLPQEAYAPLEAGKAVYSSSA